MTSVIYEVRPTKDKDTTSDISLTAACVTHFFLFLFRLFNFPYNDTPIISSIQLEELCVDLEAKTSTSGHR